MHEPAEILPKKDQARELLLARCWPKGSKFCPRCRTPHPYALAEGRLRCAGCRYTFHDFTGRWLNLTGLSALQWVTLAQAFAQELGTREIAEAVSISYNTALKALTALRLAIVAQGTDAQILFSPHTGIQHIFSSGKLISGQETPPETGFPVFGILQRGRRVFVDLVPELTVESILHFNHNFHLRVHRQGNVLVTDRYKTYEALLLCGDDSLPYHYLQTYPGDCFAHSGGSLFWKFCRERLRRYKGLAWCRFPLYLKELELRFNNQQTDLTPLLLDAICTLIPDDSMSTRT